MASTIEEKIKEQPSFDSWLRANLSEAQQKEFHFGGGARLADALQVQIDNKNLTIAPEENDNDTVTEKHEWVADARKEFERDPELAWAYSVHQQYQTYLKSL